MIDTDQQWRRMVEAAERGDSAEFYRARALLREGLLGRAGHAIGGLFDEAKHPRMPKGRVGGGEWAAKAGSDAPKITPEAKRALIEKHRPPKPYGSMNRHEQIAHTVKTRPRKDKTLAHVGEGVTIVHSHQGGYDVHGPDTYGNKDFYSGHGDLKSAFDKAEKTWVPHAREKRESHEAYMKRMDAAKQKAARAPEKKPSSGKPSQKQLEALAAALKREGK